MEKHIKCLSSFLGYVYFVFLKDVENAFTTTTPNSSVMEQLNTITLYAMEKKHTMYSFRNESTI